MEKTHNQKVKAYRKRVKKRGLVEVRVFVPKDQAAKIRSIAQELRDIRVKESP